MRAIDERTRARHAAVHELLAQGVGLLECARRLGWSLNTVKRYAHAEKTEQLLRPHRYGRTLVDPYRGHLRARLAAAPDVAVTRLLSEIREQGYTGSTNLLVRYLKQGLRQPARPARPATAAAGGLDHDPTRGPGRTRAPPSARPARPLPTAEDPGRAGQRPGLLTSRRGADLGEWMTSVDATDLPALHGFVRGLRQDLPAVVAGLSLPYSNGPIEGANNKIKYLKRQMQGRAGFPLLRQRILLG